MKINTFMRLFIKEVHHLFPLLYTLLALEVLSIVDHYYSQSPDSLSWSDFSIIYTPATTFISYVYFLLGAIAGYMIFSIERNKHTLAFLWSLPIHRYQLFMVKICSCFGLLALYFLISQLFSWFTQNFGVDSISNSQFSWSLWWREWALTVGLYGIGVCYGALISNFRIAGILGLLVLLFATHYTAFFIPNLNFIALSAMLTPEFFGKDIIIDSKAWVYHTILAIVCLLSAAYIWTKHSEPKASGKAKSKAQSRLLSGFYYLIGVVIILTSLVATVIPGAIFQSRNPTSENTLQSRYTENFLFSYYSSDAALVQALMNEADSIAEAVQALLGTNIDQQILVDITENSNDHLGIAGWRRLRINRSALTNEAERDHVFAHELSHVIADQIADRRLSENGNFTKFFNEGMAEWVSYQTQDLAPSHDALILLAATTVSRLEIEFDDFLYWAPFAAEYDSEVIYALGLAWMDSLSLLCGNAAPGKILSAMANPDLPQRLQGKIYWQEVMRIAQCDLSAVNAQFILAMKQMQPATNFIPSLVASKIRTEDAITFSMRFDETATNPVNEAYTVILKVRDNPNTSPLGVYTRASQLESGETVEFTIPAAGLSGERFQYQLGIQFIEGERAFFGRWITDA